MKKKGLAQYLKSGKRKDSLLSRNEKDKVVPLYGSLYLLEKAEEYLNKKKTWKNNYEHITISFSDEDIKELESLSNFDEEMALKDIAKIMIAHRTSGYDIEHEVIAYSELHDPKIKEEKNHFTGEIKKRRKHIHIGISYLNPLSDTKLQTTFFSNSYISDTVDKYISKKYNLTVPKPKIKIGGKMNEERNNVKEAVKDFKTIEELFSYFDLNNIKYNFTNKHSKKNSNIYIYNQRGGKIHLRGKDFLHIEMMMNKKNITQSNISELSNMKKLKEKSELELKEILNEYYQKHRIPIIEKKRSLEATKKLYFLTQEKIEEEIEHENIENTISSFISTPQTKQNKIFFEYYKTQILLSLKGFFIDTKQKNIKIINKEKKINIRDEGDRIVSSSKGSNLEEEVKIMLSIAKAKKWNLYNLIIKGSIKFKNESYRQIAIMIEKEKKIKASKVPIFAEKRYEENLDRPMMPIYNLQKEIKEKREAEEKKVSLSSLKNDIDLSQVLEYARDKFYLDLEPYQIEGQKINNIKNRQKPKNAIDFFQKECNLSTSEAISICENIYQDQIQDEYFEIEMQKKTAEENLKYEEEEKNIDSPPKEERKRKKKNIRRRT